jgi:hypothetical protein
MELSQINMYIKDCQYVRTSMRLPQSLHLSILIWIHISVLALYACSRPFAKLSQSVYALYSVANCSYSYLTALFELCIHNPCYDSLLSVTDQSLSGLQ